MIKTIVTQDLETLRFTGDERLWTHEIVSNGQPFCFTLNMDNSILGSFRSMDEALDNMARITCIPGDPIVRISDFI